MPIGFSTSNTDDHFFLLQILLIFFFLRQYCWSIFSYFKYNCWSFFMLYTVAAFPSVCIFLSGTQVWNYIRYQQET
jgi:hypothetical protein